MARCREKVTFSSHRRCKHFRTGRATNSSSRVLTKPVAGILSSRINYRSDPVRAQSTKRENASEFTYPPMTLMPGPEWNHPPNI